MERSDFQSADPVQGSGRGDRPGWIVIVRHGKPACDLTVRIKWQDYITWWQAYDRAGLAEGQEPPKKLLALALEGETFISSTLPRAMQTADAIANGNRIERDPVFVEAPLPPPRIFGRRRPRRWGVLARITWWMGFSAGGETRREAELRAEAAAATLAAHALRGQNVVVCAHGWFNRMMRPVLLSWGWKCVHDGGDDYWSYRKYVRRL